MVEKIISGGQTGADLAGVDVGLKLGLQTGGTMPGGWRTEQGDKPHYKDKYNMVEHTSRSYVPRTERNVLDSDGTLIFGKNSGGSKLTRNFCQQHNKHFWQQYWDKGTPYTTEQVKMFANWLIKHNIKVLNVAGNREEKNPGIHQTCMNFIEQALKISQDLSKDSL